MRNLKRALSLTLASVMLLGMMVVGASAAGFPDVEDTHNVEAIEVLKAVDVMVGDDKGNFGPDQQVSRAQMAVVMAKLLNLDYNYYQGQCKFTDVPNWAAPYVAACYANGIVSGYNDTTYGANDDVTAVQAASMMMRALGYFKYKEDYQPTFELATVKQASEIGIFSQVKADAKTPLTRNQVAQMALNALRTEMVTFTGTPGFEANGVTVGYRAEYTQRTGTEAKYNAIEGRTSDVASDANHKGQYYIQLGEQLYDGKLRLNNNATDVFGRPSRYWEFNGKEIGTYMKKELVRAEYTKKVTGDTLYDLLTRNTVINYDVDVFIDGETTAPASGVASRWFTKNAINRNNDAGVGGTGNGVLTQVFVDDDDKVVTIAIINTYLAIATDNYSEKKDEAKFDVYGINRTTDRIYYRDIVNGQTDKKDMKVTSELFDVKNIQKDDAVLVTVADKEIQTLVPADIIANTKIQSFETGSNDDGTGYNQSAPGNVVVDGTQYDFTAAAEYDPTVMEYYTNASTGTVNLKDKTYNVYLDRYGYAIGVKELEGVNNYVFITGIDLNGSNLGNKNADASAIFLDGTMKTVKVNMGKSEFQTLTNGPEDAVLNTWCTYTVNTDGIYTVKEVSHVNMNDDTDDNPNYIPGKNSSNVLLGADNRNNGKLAQYNQFSNTDRIKIDDKHISVAGRSKTSASYSRVYGTDNTVYLTVELAELKATGDNYGIINDVVSVNTGISNVSLEAWTTTEAIAEAQDSKVAGNVGGTITGKPTYDKSQAANGVYSLYNDNGDIIAMIVVGEDAGATKNLVYAHKAATFKEAYDEATSKWTWQRKVIYNGEEIILTEVDDGLSKLGSMVQHNWYQVKYNSDGNVVDVTKVTGDADTGALTENSDYETNYAEIDTTINNGKDTVLYTSLAPEINAKDLKMPGRTLFLNTAQTEGFRVATDVKTALIQWNNNDQKTYFETGVDSLRSIVEDLNERHTDPAKQHNYIISAVLEKGVATSVVIYDKDKVCDPYTNPDWGSGSSEVKWLDTSVITAPNYDGNGVAPTNDDVYKLLMSKGYTNISYDGTTRTWSYTTPNGLSYKGVTIAPVGKVVVKINDKTHTVNSGNTFDMDATASLGTTYAKATHGTYAKATYADGTTGYVAMTATPTITQSVTYEIGYYKIDVTSAVSGPATNANSGSTTAVTDPAGGIYAKKGAGTADMTVAVTNTTAVTGGGLSFTADNSATVVGNLPSGTTANITVKVPATTLADNVTVTLTRANQAQQIRIFVNGTETMVNVGASLNSVVNTIPNSGNSFALVQALNYGDTAGNVTPANATAVMAGNATFAAGDANKNFGNEEYVTFTAGTYTSNSVALTASYSATGGKLITIGGSKYVAVGATVTTTLTASADIATTASWNNITTHMAVAGGANDTVTYNGAKSFWAGPSAGGKLTETGATANGTDAVVLVANGETFTIVHDAKPATGTAFTSQAVTVTAVAGAT